jgi:putative DNA primase/helicase
MPTNVNIINRVRSEVPPELLEIDRWLLWKYERDPETQKRSKRPYDPRHPGERASHSDPSTWSTFERAAACFEGRGTFSGMGVVFTDADDLMGIDLDKCRDRETGEVEGWAENIVERLNTYAEVSPSGTGIKLWLYGTLPGDRRRNDAQRVEMYDEKRFFTVTGCRLPDAPRCVNRPDPEILDAFYYAVFPDDKATTKPTEQHSPAMEDKRVLARLRSDKGAAKFASVYDDGDLSGFDDNWSKADWSLASRIAYYTQDAEQVERIFDGSALARRDKWTERPDYREMTIRNAIFSLEDVYTPGKGKDRPGIDTLVDRMIDQCRGRVCISMGDEWLKYGSGVWSRVNERYVKKIADGIVRDATDEGVTYTFPLVGQVTGAAALELDVPDDVWDREPDLLPMANGTLDLRTGELLAHSPEHYITAGLDFAYDPSAECPAWLYLMDYLDENIGLGVSTFLMEFAGYALTARTELETALFMEGPQGSGKSTAIEGLTAMMGPLATKLSLKSVQERFGRGRLPGKRLVYSTELPSMKLLETDIIDALISGEMLEIERKNQHPFEYRSIAKVIQAANELPRVPNPRAGILRRAKILKFPALQGTKDESLKEMIRKERAGILNLALEGLGRLDTQGGFTEVEAICRFTEEWKSDNDAVGTFLEECLEEGDRAIGLPSIYELYAAWCKSQGYIPLNRHAYRQRANAHPFYDEDRIIKVRGTFKMRGVDLTDEGNRINEQGYKDIINFATL